MSKEIIDAVKEEAEGVKAHVSAEVAKYNQPKYIIAGFVALFVLIVVGSNLIKWIG